MTATPDSFSLSDLQAMLESAPLDITDREPETEADDDRQSRLIKIAEDAVESFTEPLDGGDAAQVHKIVMHMLVDHMIEWHSKVSHELIRQGEDMAPIGWARDAGKFQAIANILSTIECGDDDFTCTVK
jgi:hypothetical protein